METTDFRTYLQVTYTERTKKNSKYSLRSFANSLGINAACLSVILTGKRPLTEKMIVRLGGSLELSPKDIERFVSRFNQEEAKTRESNDLSLEIFELMSHWYYDAMLELARLESFRPSPIWIARTLGITVTETRIAIEKLVKFKFIEISEAGKWTILQPETDMHVNDFTSVALKRLQKQVLKLSERAIDEVAVKERYHSSMTLAIDSNKLEEAKKALREFRNKFSANLQSGGNFNQVYQLNIGLYPITSLKEKQDETITIN